jgi:site-specific DNA recombinase
MSHRTAIGYIRVSTSRQANEGVSLDAQRAAIRQYCAAYNMNLVEIAEDAGISGKSVAARPGLSSIMSRLPSLDDIIIYKLDRLARNTIEALDLVNRLEASSVSLHSITETLNTRSAMGRFFLTMLAALAEMERSQISERVQATVDHLKANGRCIGQVPYGWMKSDDGALAEDAEQQSVVRGILSMRQRGHSLRSIALTLNDQDVPSATGRAWSPESVRGTILYHSVLLNRQAPKRG